MSKRVIKIAVTDTAKAQIEKLAGRLDMKEMGVASRVYEWLSRQSDDVVVKGVLGLLPEGYEAEIVTVALRRMAAKKKGEKPGRPKKAK